MLRGNLSIKLHHHGISSPLLVKVSLISVCIHPCFPSFDKSCFCQQVRAVLYTAALFLNPGYAHRNRNGCHGHQWPRDHGSSIRDPETRTKFYNTSRMPFASASHSNTSTFDAGLAVIFLIQGGTAVMCVSNPTTSSSMPIWPKSPNRRM
jgi:hypothetical protein